MPGRETSRLLLLAQAMVQKKTLDLVLSIFLALIWLFFAFPKILGAEMSIEQFEAWGYPDWFRVLVGATELGFAGLVLWRRSAYLVGLAMGPWVIVALATHINVGEWMFLPLPVLVAGLTFYNGWRHRDDSMPLGPLERLRGSPS